MITVVHIYDHDSDSDHHYYYYDDDDVLLSYILYYFPEKNKHCIASWQPSK